MCFNYSPKITMKQNYTATNRSIPNWQEALRLSHVHFFVMISCWDLSLKHPTLYHNTNEMLPELLNVIIHIYIKNIYMHMYSIKLFGFYYWMMYFFQNFSLVWCTCILTLSSYSRRMASLSSRLSVLMCCWWVSISSSRDLILLMAWFWVSTKAPTKF